jgi:aminomuconate-semialdehyde/2-hydroxymuconate-6-semialdehyde dehydrogenase
MAAHGLRTGRPSHRLADLMDEHAAELAMADTRDMGKPLTQALADVARSSWNVRFFADHARLSMGDAYPMDSGHHAYARFDPVGVAVAISPWNFPLMLGTWKVAPALAWGNTVVMKPAEDTPVSATLWARLALEAGMPPGVLNVVHGYGPDSAGAALTAHPDVDRITFTGESGTGKVISGAASSHLVPVSLELGGKGANIVFDDAEIDNAVHWAVQAIFRNAGQICLSGSRLYLQAGIYDAFVERFVTAAEALRAGDPKEPETEFPLALASEEHYRKVSGYLDTVQEDGGRILTGGLGEAGACYPRSSSMLPRPRACAARRSSAPSASSRGSSRRTRLSLPPTTRDTASMRWCSPRTSHVPIAWPLAFAPARCGSTASSSATCAPRSEASAIRVWAARVATSAGSSSPSPRP